MADALPPGSTHKDRSAGLAVFGLLQIGLGLLCALFVLLSLLQLAPSIRHQVELAQGRPPQLRGVLFGVAFYGMMATFFIWTGTGALLKRRWVRPVMLSVSWMCLVTGVLGMSIGAVMIPRLVNATIAQTPGLPPQMGMIMGVVVTLFMAIFYVLLPLALVLFYKSPHVRATLVACDPAPRWTDSCPIPVLGLSLCLGGMAMCMFLAASFAFFPFFTVVISGPPAIACVVVLAMAYAYFARAAFRLRPIGWWGPLVMLPLHMLSSAIYFKMGSIDAYVAATGLSPAQGRILTDSGLFGGSLLLVSCLAWLVALVGYLFWVRKYFTAPGMLGNNYGATGGL